MRFIVIVGRIIGGLGRPFVTVWSSDMEEKRTLKAAVSYGFKVCGSDDFRVGEKRGARLVAVSWMGQKFFDEDEVTDTAEQLGLKRPEQESGR